MIYYSRIHWPEASFFQLISTTQSWIWIGTTIIFSLYLGSGWRSPRYTLAPLVLVNTLIGSESGVVIIHIFFYVKNARKKQSGQMLGPINLEMTHSIDGLESAMHKEHEIYFDFARIISEVPSEFYETMKARLIRLTGTDTSFDCTHRELYRLPSIKLKGACTQQLYEFTSQEYIVGCLPQRKILELQEDRITWQLKQVQMVTDGSSALHSSNGIHSTSQDGRIMNVSTGMRSRCTRKQNLVYHFEEIYSMK